MKNILLLTLVVCGFLSVAYGQTDTITIKKTFLGTMYKKDGRLMNLYRLKKELKSDAVASLQFKKARNIHSVAMVCSFVGGCLIGWEWGKASVGGSIDPVVMGSGIALGCTGIALCLPVAKHMKRAVRTYNADRRRTGNVPYEPDLYFTVSGSGVGIIWKF